MFMPIYTLEKLAEARLADLRAEAARQRSIAPPEPPDSPAGAGPIRWIQVQIFGR
jgi:hypothetical protein